MISMVMKVDGAEYTVTHNDDWAGSVEIVGGGLCVSVPVKLFQVIGRNATLQDVISKVEDMFVADGWSGGSNP